MPGSSRSKSFRGCSSPPRRPIAIIATSVLAAPAWAASGTGAAGPLAHTPWHDLTALALVLGIALFAIVSAVMLLRTRARAAAERAGYRSEIDALRASAGEAHTLLLSEPQVLIVWPADGRDPDM